MRGGAVWRAMKTAPVQVNSVLEGRWFGLRIVAHAPGDGAGDAASLVKPLVDGVVSALHRHDGHDLDELSRRLAFLHGIGPAAARELLVDDQTAALGTRRLLWRRSGGVQWDPGDDACVVGELRLERGAPAWALSGELFEVEPL
jgi:hypothetical protein